MSEAATVQDAAPSVWLWAAIGLAGVVGSAVFSGLETAFYAANPVRRAIRASAGDASAGLAEREYANRSGVLATLLIGNNLFNYLGSIGVAALLTAAGMGEIGILVVSAVVLTPLLFVFGESVPKELARRFADAFSELAALPLRVIRLGLTGLGILPLVLLFARAATRLTPVGGEGPAPLEPRARVAALLQESAGFGAITAKQADLVERSLALEQATVGEEAVAWADVQLASIDWDHDTALQRLAGSRHSRVPVVDRRGQPIGVLTQIDLYLNPGASVRDVVEPVLTLDPSISVRDGIEAMQQQSARLAVVVTGDGSARQRRARPRGIVTLKDLVEPLTGELQAW
ncbi:MAG: CNNM domain-containing protein [Planctomycetota bacterium]